jgi:hypothetical protein
MSGHLRGTPSQIGTGQSRLTDGRGGLRQPGRDLPNRTLITDGVRTPTQT